MPYVVAMVEGVRELGLESCMTLGMLTEEQAGELAEAGLDYYNHNLDTSPEYYGDIITTRTYKDRLDTLGHVRTAGMKVCSGGIVGMGEGQTDRAGLLQQLANLPEHPESVPINMLVRVEGTPLAYFAGANSIFYGEKLLTTANPQANSDMALFSRPGIEPERRAVSRAPATPDPRFYDAVSTKLNPALRRPLKGAQRQYLSRCRWPLCWARSVKYSPSPVN